MHGLKRKKGKKKYSISQMAIYTAQRGFYICSIQRKKNVFKFNKEKKARDKARKKLIRNSIGWKVRY